MQTLRGRMADNGSRLAAHLQSCADFPGNPVTVERSTSGCKSRRLDITSFFDRMSEEDQPAIDNKLGDLVFGLGLPFSIVEAQPFVQFVHALRPAYKLPNRSQLSTRILDQHYKELQEEVAEEIHEANSVSTVLDAWTNCRNESVVGFTVTTPRPFFLKAMFTGQTRHTEDFYFTETANVIRELGERKVTAVITDNAAPMKAMWRLIESTFSGIV